MPAESAKSWPHLLTALLRGEDLGASDTDWAMDEIMRGDATPAQVAGFAVALRAKGETVAEIEGFVRAMYRHARLIEVPGRVVDIVGTGGDRAGTVNISTMSAIVTAGAGATVVKHGSRAASSSSGAADVLEQLGVTIDLSAKQVAAVAARVGITFCFAALFHPALRHVASPRSELGVPTVFNVLGPLTNPARPAASAIGVADPRLAPIMAGVLARRGVDALVFRGDDGLDEITVTTTSTVWVVRHGEVCQQTLDPRDLGVPRSSVEALRGGDPAYNADVARRLLAGEHGAVRDAVLLSSAAALAVLDATDEPLVDRLRDGMRRAEKAIDSGAAATLLDRWVTATRELAAG